MANTILLQPLRFWLEHPWLVFWGANAGYFGLGLWFASISPSLSHEAEDIARSLFIVVVAVSLVQGLRVSWKASPPRAMAILLMWGSLPIVNNFSGFSAQRIMFALIWMAVPATLAVGLEYVARLIAHRKVHAGIAGRNGA